MHAEPAKVARVRRACEAHRLDWLKECQAEYQIRHLKFGDFGPLHILLSRCESVERVKSVASLVTFLTDTCEQDINKADRQGRTPFSIFIHTAPLAYVETADAVEFLLNRGANPNVVPQYDQVPLLHALAKGAMDVTYKLLHHPNLEASILSRKEQHNALHVAARYLDGSKPGFLLTILRHKFPRDFLQMLEAPDALKYSPLAYAAYCNNPHACKALLLHGANPLTALRVAMRCKLPIVKELLAASDKVVLELQSQAHYLCAAVQARNEEVIRLLVAEYNVCPTLHDDKRNTALHQAIIQNNPAIMRILLASRASVNIDALDAHGNTPLHIGAQCDFRECTKILLS